MADETYLERALFVVGRRDAGKSHQLRAMFLDRRFGTDGEYPGSPGRLPVVHLSHLRRLAIRVASPHERGQSVEEYLERVRNQLGPGRWCFAGALQSGDTGTLPGPKAYLESFVQELTPERVRVCILSPDFQDRTLETALLERRLRRIPSVETVSFDATADIFEDPEEAHGLFLADFFDFS